MSNPNAKPKVRERREGVGYEKRDANAKWIFGIVAFLLVAGLTMHFLLAGMMERLEKRPLSGDEWSGARRRAEITAKAAPHLQLDPPKELGSFRAIEETELSTYGWIDRTAGVVRIPVARAMELLLERGLPMRSETNGAAAGPSNYELQQERPKSGQAEMKEIK